MKNDDLLLGGAHAAGIIRGHLGTQAAGPDVLLRGVTDGQNVTDTPSLLEFAGLTVLDLGGGVTLVWSSWKVPVTCATTVAGTLASSFENGDTVDGITLATGDRILIKDQASAAENGIYTVNASGAPSRSLDTGLSDLVLGAVVYVVSGTANAGAVFACSNTTAPVLDTDAITWVRVNSGGGGGGGTGAASWFNVRDYGAVRDSTTDDAAAINLAIAAYNAAGGGVLYFPGGSGYYKCTTALTALTAPGLVLGDGSTGSADGATASASELVCTSGTATFLTIPSGVEVRDLALRNTAGSVTAGYGLGTSASAIRFQIENVSSTGFWIDFDLDGGLWAMSCCYARQAHKYGIDVSYAAVPDGGDTTISDTVVVEGANSSDAGIHISSGGGLKIVNSKMLGASSGMAHGIWLDVANAVTASVLLISNCSIEDTRGDNILLQTTGTGVWRGINVTDCEFHNGVVTNAYALELSGGAANGIKDVFLDGINAHLQSAGSVTALRLTNTTNVWIGSVIADNYTGRWTDNGGNSGYADDTGSVAGIAITGFATPAFVLGTAAAAGSAGTVVRSDATLLAFDATSPAAVGTVAAGSAAVAARRDHVHATGAGTPTTSAIGDAAATGTGPAAAMTNHVHGREALSTATPLVESGAGAVGTGTKNSREDHVHPASSGTTGVGTYGLLVADGTTAPPVALYTEDGTDFLYADG